MHKYDNNKIENAYRFIKQSLQTSYGNCVVDNIFSADINEDGYSEFYYNIRFGKEYSLYSISSYDTKLNDRLLVHVPLRTNSNYRFIIYNESMFLAFNEMQDTPMSNLFDYVFIPVIEDQSLNFVRCDDDLEKQIIAHYDKVYD